MTTTLKSPGPGFRPLRFSDGSSIWMPPDATTENWRTATQQGEAALDQKYMAQAQAEDRPITTAGKVYSATVARPNTPYGHLLGWLDHNAGGNALNRNATAQTVSNAVEPFVGAGDRIATMALDANPIVGGADIIGSGFNVAKHLAGINSIPDYKTAPELLRTVTGAPDLPANASPAQRVAESTLALMTNPQNALATTAARVGGSYLGGQAGNLVGGEPGQFIGSIAGGSPEGLGNIALRGAQPVLGGTQGPEVIAAGERQGIQPTAGAVANPVGRLFEKAVGAIPVVGGPVKAAQERYSSEIQAVLNDVANRVYTDQPGVKLPSTITKASIGADVLSGARQGQIDITQREGDKFGKTMDAIGPNQPTDLRSVYRPMSQLQFSTDPDTYAPLGARLANLVNMSVQAQQPQFQAVSGPMPPGSVPFSRAAGARSNLGATLPNVGDLSVGLQKDLYGRLTDTMRAAAAAKDPSLGVAFDIANENYNKMVATRKALEAVGGQPSGGYGQFNPGDNAESANFTGGKQGEGQAYNWLVSNLNSPSKLAPFADPTVVPNSYWRSVAGQLIGQLGQTPEGTFRPDWMARDWNGPKTGIDPEVQTQLFSGPGGQATGGISTMNDLATLGRNAVVPIDRAGLTNTAGAVLGVKWLLDAMKAGAGTAAAAVGGRALASGMENPAFVNAMGGKFTPLVDALYKGVPAATQNVAQFQDNPPYSPSF
jgi:hypothetical protein